MILVWVGVVLASVALVALFAVLLYMHNKKDASQRTVVGGKNTTKKASRDSEIEPLLVPSPHKPQLRTMSIGQQPRPPPQLEPQPRAEDSTSGAGRTSRLDTNRKTATVEGDTRPELVKGKKTLVPGIAALEFVESATLPLTLVPGVGLAESATLPLTIDVAEVTGLLDSTNPTAAGTSSSAVDLQSQNLIPKTRAKIESPNPRKRLAENWIRLHPDKMLPKMM